MPKDSPLFSLKLVKAVEKHECIYNVNSSSYNHRDRIQEAWSKIAAEVGETPIVCRDSWRNLRTVYGRHMKKCSREGKKPRKYYLMDMMSFVAPFVKQKPCTVCPDASSCSHQVRPVKVNTETDPTDFGDEGSASVGDEEGLGFVDTDAIDIDEPTKKKSRTESEDQFQDEESYIPVPNTSTLPPLKSSAVSSEEKKCRKMFLLSLASDVDKMTYLQMRKFRRKVVELIDDIFEESGEYDERVEIEEADVDVDSLTKVPNVVVKDELYDYMTMEPSIA